jgi:hypothetical protein
VTFTTWLEDMRALGEPPSGSEAWAAMLDAATDAGVPECAKVDR